MTELHCTNPLNEDDLKRLKVEYLSNPLLDNTQNKNLSLDDKTFFLNPQNEDDLQWKTSSKYQTWNISATSVWFVTLEFFGGKFEDNSEEISSVALLSPACYTYIVVISLLSIQILIIGLFIDYDKYLQMLFVNWMLN